MAKSRSRLFADMAKTLYSNDTEEKSFDQIKATTTDTNETTLNTASATAASAVTFFINATKDTSSHFTTVSAVKTSSTEVDFIEYGTIISDSSLVAFSIDINSGSFRLRATPTVSNVNYSITRILVETHS